MNKITLALLTVAVSVTGVLADNSSNKTFKQVVASAPECKFRDQELQIDLFSIGTFYNQGYSGLFGGGVGVNYFFTKFIGIGLEQGILARENAGKSVSDSEYATSGSLFFRYPVSSLNLAPYALVGGGGAYGTGSAHGFGNVGGGVEGRVTNNIGLFADARWVYSSENPKSALLVRTGVRFAF